MDIGRLRMLLGLITLTVLAMACGGPTPTPATLPTGTTTFTPALTTASVLTPSATPTSAPVPEPTPTGTPTRTPIPAPVAAFSVGVSSENAPVTVQFTDMSEGSITSGEWDFGDGSSSTAQSPRHLYTLAGS